MSEIHFDPTDPFPLLPAATFSYEEEKRHSEKVDAWLGFETDTIEKRLLNSALAKQAGREFWIGKSVQTFSTPYTEFRSILNELKPVERARIVDLGAGYGRLAHVLAAHFPSTHFLGFEMVEPRRAEGQRLIDLKRLGNARLECSDVTTIDLKSTGATAFFIYDFGSRDDVETCIANLKLLAENWSITVVARGGRSRDIIEKNHPWLSQVVKPSHHDHYSVYRSRESSQG